MAGHIGFVMDSVKMAQVFSELNSINHPGLVLQQDKAWLT
jgi:hypothetical protein